MKASWARLDLSFRFVARTSRETMTQKPTWFLRLRADDGSEALGECALFHGLSADDCPDHVFERRLNDLCHALADGASYEEIRDRFADHSALLTGLETAWLSLKNGGLVAPSPFTAGQSDIAINGLVWMGSHDEMLERINSKLDEGFTTIKLKIGGINFDDELALLQSIRNRYTPEQIELRLDANGAFKPGEALARLERLSRFTIHSIEQPIAARQPGAMAEICRNSPIPVALDEELIGVKSNAEKAELLDFICPQYIILKPTLCGGISAASQWVNLARQREIGSWYTSALESNVGLSAIAQAAFAEYGADAMPQGLGTGELYHNNVPGPIERRGSRLCFCPERPLEIPNLQWTEV